MKTKLPQSITNRDEAMALLQSLIDNGEMYHPEDDATDIAWSTLPNDHPTQEEGEQLNKLMEDIYNLEGNNGDHKNPKFDPCTYIVIHENEQTKQIKEIIEEMGKGHPHNKIANDRIIKFHVKNWLMDTIIEPGMGMQEIVEGLQTYFPVEYAKAMDNIKG